MGSAMARALCLYGREVEVSVSNPTSAKLEKLKNEFPEIQIFNDNAEAIKGCDVMILAVKPWIINDVIEQISPIIDVERQILVSVAGGIEISTIESMIHLSCLNDNLKSLPIFRVIPNTAIAHGQGMTFISHNPEGSKSKELIKTIFGYMGDTGDIPESQMDAATALSSCGIAYVFKGVQAAVQAGVQLGFKPTEALRYVNATVRGAAALLESDGATPQAEIDKVTTPGGMTIKGINSLEHDGFASAIINAILAPLGKK